EGAENRLRPFVAPDDTKKKLRRPPVGNIPHVAPAVVQAGFVDPADHDRIGHASPAQAPGPLPPAPDAVPLKFIASLPESRRRMPGERRAAPVPPGAARAARHEDRKNAFAGDQAK